MNTKPIRLLFLCTGNSCRSIMAEAMTNYYSNGRYLAFSAGSAPTGSVHPKAAETLVNHGIKPNASRSKSWNEFKFPQIIFILDRLVWFGAEIAAFCWNKLILWRQL